MTILNYKELKRIERESDERFNKFIKELHEEGGDMEFNVYKLKEEWRREIESLEGTRLSNGILYVFKRDNLELNVFFYYPEEVVPNSEKNKLMKEAQLRDNPLPHLKFIPSSPVIVRMREYDGKSEKPVNVTTMRYTHPKEVLTHQYFKK